MLSLLVALTASPALAADTYKVDDSHSSVHFKVLHLGAGMTWGRFNTLSGSWSQEGNAPDAITLTLETESVDSDNEKRDKHLRNADFFDAGQFPEITFTSQSIKPAGDGVFKVAGDLTLHGVTKKVAFDLRHTGEGKDPWGGYRSGYEAEFTIQRSDFGMTYMADGVGDTVTLYVAIEGKQK